MFEQLKALLVRQCRLDLARPLLVGVSGGPDSLYLLHVLWRLGLPLVAAHLDHQLRPGSAAESEYVRGIAEKLDIPFRLGVEDVLAQAEALGLSLEEAARRVRYRFLFAEAEGCQAQGVAVAHTADDQVETLMMHLLRGSGTAGLRGMSFYSRPNPWSASLPLLRPLLNTWRSDILAYLADNALQPLYDPSNQDVRYYRNYLRHVVIPGLEKEHPRLRQRLWRTASILHEDYAVLEMALERAWQECLLRQGPGYVAFALEKFRSQPVGLQRGLARRALDQLRPGLRDIDFQTTEAFLSFAMSPSRTAQRDLAAGLRLFYEPGALWLAAWEAQLPAALGGQDLADAWPQVFTPLEFGAPATVDLGQGWYLQAALVELAQLPQPPGSGAYDPWTAWLDAQALQFPLLLRGRLPGERFQPLGMGGHSQKLSDFMINRKLPQRARPAWPLVLSGGAVAWIAGVATGHAFRVTPATRQGLRLELRREPGVS